MRSPVLFSIFLLFSIIGGSLLIDDYGMSWDEPTRWASGDMKLDYYERLYQSEDKDAVWGSMGRDLYPGLFDLPLAALHKYGHLDRFWWGHFFSFLYGLVGALSAGGIVYLITGSLPVSFFTVLSVITMPRYFGHMFINPKDIPFAGVYTLGIFLIIWRLFRSSSISWKDIVLVGIGAGLAMSMRTVGGIIILYAILCCWLLNGIPNGLFFKKGTLYKTALQSIMIAAIACSILLVFWPYAHQNPFKASTATVVALQSDAREKPLLFMGEMMNAGDAPYYALPWMWMITIPLGYIILFIAGAISYRRTSLTYPDYLKSGLLGISICFPLLFILLTQSSLHNGIRHTLFLFPPFCALLGIMLFESIQAQQRNKRIQYLIYFALSIFLGSNLYSLIRLHPYEYTFFNALIGGTAGAYGQYETEYWFTSNREAVEWLNQYVAAQNEQDVRLLITGPHHGVKPFLSDKIKLVDQHANPDYLILNSQMLMNELFPGKEIHRIEKAGLPIVIIKKSDSHE